MTRSSWRGSRIFCIVAVLFLIRALTAVAQATDPGPGPVNATSTVFIARGGEHLDPPHVMSYHYLQLLHQRGKWIYPDVGYVDYAHGNYREVFLGAGRTLINGKHLTLTEELYFVQALGPAAKSARYVWPWTMLQIHFTPKLSSETVYFPYVPLNNSATIQHVLERSKLEYAVRASWKVGAGYGGYKYGDSEWQHNPFLTTTLSTRAGAFEFWLQKTPGSAQLQLRYALASIGR
jgi:hypothetical protein